MDRRSRLEEARRNIPPRLDGKPIRTELPKFNPNESTLRYRAEKLVAVDPTRILAATADTVLRRKDLKKGLGVDNPDTEILATELYKKIEDPRLSLRVLESTIKALQCTGETWDLSSARLKRDILLGEIRKDLPEQIQKDFDWSTIDIVDEGGFGVVFAMHKVRSSETPLFLFQQSDCPNAVDIFAYYVIEDTIMSRKDPFSPKYRDLIILRDLRSTAYKVGEGSAKLGIPSSSTSATGLAPEERRELLRDLLARMKVSLRSEDDPVKYARAVLEGFCGIHGVDVAVNSDNGERSWTKLAHGDGTESNIVVVTESTGKLKIVFLDYGFACPLYENYPEGTPQLRLPDHARTPAQSHEDEQYVKLENATYVDFWSAGRLVCELFLPKTKDHLKRFFKKDENGDRPKRVTIDYFDEPGNFVHQLPNDLKELLCKLLVYDPRERLPSDKWKQERFFVSNT
ncbi:hypothetical protein HDU93_006007 [Gonapodya sp. JEL0774]|nr:hypothetical protein HDU93_006007 [Gonapodya sp. JEL0774]